jgi:O-antigen/teichoic acid export membrane protein
MIAVGAACSLVSVPLALHYLPAEEFGLWAVVFQVAGYFALADTGISSAIGRLLIDHRSERPSKAYGAVFFGGLAVLFGLSVVVLACGFALLPFLPVWLNIGGHLRTEFGILAAVQIVVTAASLPIRSVGQSILSAARYDLLHACLSASILANLAALWIAFVAGAGVFAFAWAALAGYLVSSISQFGVAWHLRTLPGHGEISFPRGGQWRPMGAFAGDVIFVQLGNTLVFSTQTVIVSSALGLTAAATWAAGSKLFYLFFQLAGKVAEVAGPQMAGMHVAGESGKLDRTIRRIVALTVGTASAAAVALVAGNSLFVKIWTGGKISWPSEANLPLAVWLVLASVAAALTSHALAAKRLARIRHVYLIEGVFGTALAAWVAPQFGIPGVAGAFALSCLLFSFRATVMHFLFHENPA